MRIAAPAVALAALLLAACSGEVLGTLPVDSGLVGPSDAQPSAGPDAGPGAADATAEPGADASPAAPDADLAGPDAALPGPDASSSPGPDAAEPGLDASSARPDASSPPGPSSTRLTARPLGSTTAPNGFYEYLPPGYDDGAPRPLLVFWHGIGEDGNGTTDLGKVLATAIPQLISGDQWPADRPFVVLMPQHGPANCPGRDEIHDFIAWALLNYRIDPKRAFLTGLSCGAIGSWDYLGTYLAQQVAAAVLVAGDPGDPTQSWSAWGRAGCSLGEVAIWALHGDADGTVWWGNEDATMKNLLACPSPPRRDAVWTVIPGGSHFIWNPVYDLSGGYGDVYAWLLAHPMP